jgi:hypothetical protein
MIILPHSFPCVTKHFLNAINTMSPIYCAVRYTVTLSAFILYQFKFKVPFIQCYNNNISLQTSSSQTSNYSCLLQCLKLALLFCLFLEIVEFSFFSYVVIAKTATIITYDQCWHTFNLSHQFSLSQCFDSQVQLQCFIS